MRLALVRHGEGEPLDLGELPYDVQRVLVAARFGVLPAVIDDMPAGEFRLAIATLGVRI